MRKQRFDKQNSQENSDEENNNIMNSFDKQLSNMKINFKIKDDDITKRQVEMKKHLDIQSKQIFSKQDNKGESISEFENLDFNQIENLKTQNKSVYEQFITAFNIFNILKNDILKILNMVEEIFVLNQELETKFAENSRLQKLKFGTSYYFNMIINTIKQKIQKLEENYSEQGKIIKMLIDQNKVFQEQFFKMFEIIQKLMKIKDGLQNNSFQNLIYIIFSTKMKIGLDYYHPESINNEQKSNIKEIFIDIIQHNKTFGQIPNNYFFNSDLIEESAKSDDKKNKSETDQDNNIEKKTENIHSKTCEQLNTFITVNHDLLHNIIYRNQKLQFLDDQSELVINANNQVIDRNFKRADQLTKNPSSKFKQDENDIILSYMWDDDVHACNRTAMTIYQPVTFSVTIRHFIEQIKYEIHKIRTLFDNLRFETKDGEESEMNKIKVMCRDIYVAVNTGKFYNKTKDIEIKEQNDGIKTTYNQLKDFIKTINSVDEKILPTVQNHISTLSKLIIEYINHNRNSESLPKILKFEIKKRNKVKNEKKEAINEFENVKENYGKELEDIVNSKNLHARKTRIADVSIVQRQNLFANNIELKQNIKILKEKLEKGKKIYEDKLAKQKLLLKEINDLQEANSSISDDIQQLEVQKLELYKDKNKQEQLNIELKKDCELDNDARYDRWRTFTTTKNMKNIPDILMKICKEKGYDSMDSQMRRNERKFEDSEF